ncbi:hypothetical protein Bbelb_183760 [Branchiostoma belcheri]|nr:hypothetical protein Bbelb_183760 [Branchiostoma belcheri]
MEHGQGKQQKKSAGSDGKKISFQESTGDAKDLNSTLSKTSMSSSSTATNGSGQEETWTTERPSTDRVPLEVQLQKIILSGESPVRDGAGKPRRQPEAGMDGGGKETVGSAATEDSARPQDAPQEHDAAAGKGEQPAEATGAAGPGLDQAGVAKDVSAVRRAPTLPLTVEDARLLAHTNRQLHAEVQALQAELTGVKHRHDQRARHATQTMGDLQQELRRTQAELEKYKCKHDSEFIRSGLPGRPSSQPTGPARQRGKCPAQDSRVSQVTYLRVPDECFPAPASKKPMSALNIDDVMRTNQRVLDENEVLRDEVQRLRRDNSSLLRLVKWLAADNRICLNHIHTSVTDRRDLTKKLHKEKTETKKLQGMLQQRAHAWVRDKQREEGLEEENKWNKISHISVLGAKKRADANRVQKFYTRTVPVSSWDDPFSRPDYLGTRVSYPDCMSTRLLP